MGSAVAHPARRFRGVFGRFPKDVRRPRPGPPHSPPATPRKSARDLLPKPPKHEAARRRLRDWECDRPDDAAASLRKALDTMREPNELFLDARAKPPMLLASSGEKKVNVRSHLPDEPRSREFVFGLGTAQAAIEALHRLTAEPMTLRSRRRNLTDDMGETRPINHPLVAAVCTRQTSNRWSQAPSRRRRR